jgi:chemotaxis protein MotB
MKSSANALASLALLRARPSSQTESEADQEGWMVSYADLITLLFIFFAIMLSISSVSRAKFDLLTRQFNQASTASLLDIKKHLDQEIQRQQLQTQVTTEIGDEGLQIRFNEKVLFASGEAQLNAEGGKTLGAFSGILGGIQDSFRVAVEGHTDSLPIHTAAYPSNWALSADRSVNVLHFLAAHGVAEKKMMVRAYADTRPLNGAAAGAQDRRVTLLVY